MRRGVVQIAVIGAALCVAPTLFAQPQFKGMGTPPPGIYGQSPVMLMRALADTGEVFGTVKGSAVVWTPNTGYQLLLPLVDNVYSGIDGCTPDGKLLVGIAADSATNERAVPVMWQSRSERPKTLPGFPDGWSCTDAHTNADGTVIAGGMLELATNKHAIFFWRAGVRKNLGCEFITQWPPGVISAGLSDLSNDGTIGVGAGPDASLGGFSGIRWTKQGGLQVIPDVPGGENDGVFGTCDGSGFRAAGRASPPEEGDLAAVWDPINSWTVLGKLKPTDTGAGVSIDSTGFFAVGSSGFAGGQNKAIVWNPRDGMRSAQEYLVADLGLAEADTWPKLGGTMFVSPTGRFISGLGADPQGKGETWWAEIRPFCYADCDNSTSPKGKNAGPPVLDIDDFLCFMTKYAIGDYLYTDCDLDGYLTIADFICFQTKFAEGCP